VRSIRLPSLSKACQPCTSTKRSPSPNPGSRPWRPGHPPSRASPLDTPIVPTAATPLTLTPQFVEARQRRAHLPRTLPTAMAVSPSRSADPESQTEMHTVTVKTSVQWQVLSRPLVRGFALALTLALALPPSHPPPPPRPRPNPHLHPRPGPPPHPHSGQDLSVAIKKKWMGVCDNAASKPHTILQPTTGMLESGEVRAPYLCPKGNSALSPQPQPQPQPQPTLQPQLRSTVSALPRCSR
jgi:hypothetical protein